LQHLHEDSGLSRNWFVILFSFTLFACGGSGSDTTSENVPSAPNEQVTAVSIFGLWSYRYPDSQCLETFQFNRNNTFVIESNTFEASGTFTLSANTAIGSTSPISLNFIEQTPAFEGVDCDGENVDIRNTSITLDASFKSNLNLVFSDPNDNSELFDLTRDNTLSFVNAPSSLNSDQQLRISIEKVYDDQFVPGIEYGPTGMEISDSGALIWSPSIPMFKDEIDISFGISIPSSVSTLEATITLSETSFNVPTVEKHIGANQISKSMVAGDFDGDGIKELLTSDRNNVLSIFTPSKGNINHDWAYPFPLGGPVARQKVAAHDVNADNKDEIIVFNDKKIYVIDAVSGVAEVIYQSEDYIFDFYVGPLSAADDALSIVLQTSENSIDRLTTTTEYNIEIVSYPSLSTQKLGPIDRATSIVIANFDADAQFEILTNAGQVFDTNTADLENYQLPNLGEEEIVVFDYDNDGRSELLLQQQGRAYIANIQGERLIDLPTFLNTVYLSSGIAINLDSDQEQELILGYTGSFGIIAYDIVNGEAIELWRESDFNTGQPKDFVAADFNNDNQPELVWNEVSGVGDRDRIAVSQVNNENGIYEYLSDDLTALGRTAFVDYTDVSPSEKAAIFVTEESSSIIDTFRGVRTIKVFDDGNIDISVKKAARTSLQGSSIITRTDRFNDIALVTLDFGDINSLQIEELDSNLAIRNINFANESDIADTLTIDINADNNEDLLIVTGNKLLAYDLLRNEIIFEDVLPRFFQPELSQITTPDGQVYIALSDPLFLYRLEGQSLTKISEHTTGCEFATFTNDKLICYTRGNEFTILSLDGQQTNLVAFKDLPHRHQVFGMTSIPNSNNVFVTLQSDEEENSFRNTYTAEVNPFVGKFVWRSPLLWGSPTSAAQYILKEDNKPSVMLANDKAIYISN